MGSALSAGIKVGGALLGGLVGSSSSKKDAKEAYKQNKKTILNQPGWIRKGAEEAGFNPLVFAGSQQLGGNFSVSAGNFMGQAIADAAMYAADAFASDPEEKLRVQNLELQNARLIKEIQQMTIRPRTPGVMETAVPFTPQVVSKPEVEAMTKAPEGLRPFADTLPVDPRREVENGEIKTSSGFMVVDNPYLPGPLYAPTLDGDEPLQWYDYPSLAIPAAIGLGVEAFKLGDKLGAKLDDRRGTGPTYTIGGQKYRQRKSPAKEYYIPHWKALGGDPMPWMR